MSLRGLNGCQERVNCEKVSFEVSGTFGKEKIEHALVVPTLDLSRQTLSMELVRRINQVEKVHLKPFQDAQVSMLIGQDNWLLITSKETRKLGEIGLALSRSALGWTVHGYLEEGKELGLSWNINATCFTDDATTISNELRIAELERVVNQYLELENLGVVAAAENGNKDERALAILEATSRKKGKGWETGLLWKPGLIPNLNGRATASKRLFQLERKLDKNPKLAVRYYAEMERLIENGYAKKVDENVKRPRIWYVPHFNVAKANKPDKVKVVFNAAAKTGGVSLNSLLETGPDLLESLLGVLLRFRQFRVALKANIKDMYLRVSLIERDRAAQRFLWRGADRDREPDEYENTSLIFGSKSSPCSAMYIKNKNAERFIDVKPEAAQSIIKNCYVDDYLTSGETVAEMQQRMKDVSAINREADFHMHGWASNESRVVKDVCVENKLGQEDKSNLCNDEERVLGLHWDRNEDTLSFNVGHGKIPSKLLRDDIKPTKREFFSVAMSVYDPLGIIAPFTVQSKLIMQNVWRTGVNWDSHILDDEFETWQIWLKKFIRNEEMQDSALLSR